MIVHDSILMSVYFTILVNGRGNFIPSQNIPAVWTPGAAAGVDDERNGFTPVIKINNVTKWTQNIEGIPVYGAVLTTHNDEKGG